MQISTGLNENVIFVLFRGKPLLVMLMTSMDALQLVSFHRPGII